MENTLTTCTEIPFHPRLRRPRNVPPCGEPATHRLTGQGEDPRILRRARPEVSQPVHRRPAFQVGGNRLTSNPGRRPVCDRADDEASRPKRPKHHTGRNRNGTRKTNSEQDGNPEATQPKKWRKSPDAGIEEVVGVWTQFSGRRRPFRISPIDRVWKGVTAQPGGHRSSPTWSISRSHTFTWRRG